MSLVVKEPRQLFKCEHVFTERWRSKHAQLQQVLHLWQKSSSRGAYFFFFCDFLAGFTRGLCTPRGTRKGLEVAISQNRQKGRKKERVWYSVRRYFRSIRLRKYSVSNGTMSERCYNLYIHSFFDLYSPRLIIVSMICNI